MIRERGNVLLRQLDRYLGIPLTIPASIFRKLAPKTSSISGAERIGVVCLGAMGDLLLASVLINGIHKQNPDAHIELVTSKANAAAIPLLPHISRSFSAPITAIGTLLTYIRSRHFSMLFDTGQWARVSALLANFSGAGKIIGFRTQGQWRSRGYDISVAHQSKVHESDNFLALGRAVWDGFTANPGLQLPPYEQKRDIICCHMWPAPGRGQVLKQWPEDHWAQLIRQLLGRGYRVSLTGSPGDAPAISTFLHKYFPGADGISSLAGQMSIAELGDYFGTIAAVISVNTGPMHLAALAGVPTIGLHGATNPKRWGPIGARAISLVPQKGHFGYLNLGFEYPPTALPAMQHISVEDVLEGLERSNVHKVEPEK